MIANQLEILDPVLHGKLHRLVEIEIAKGPGLDPQLHRILRRSEEGHGQGKQAGCCRTKQ